MQAREWAERHEAQQRNVPQATFMSSSAWSSAWARIAARYLKH